MGLINQEQAVRRDVPHPTFIDAHVDLFYYPCPRIEHMTIEIVLNRLPLMIAAESDQEIVKPINIDINGVTSLPMHQ